MNDLFRTLVGAEGYSPVGQCYGWEPGLVSLHAIADALIGLSFLSIALMLVYLIRTAREQIPLRFIFVVLGLFIVAGGFTHLLQVWTVWEPRFWVSGTMKVITAVASLGAALSLPPLLPSVQRAAAMARDTDLRRRELEGAHDELQALVQRLRLSEEAKGQFFANVSHELRTPLALIVAPASKLLERLDLDSEARRAIDTIIRNARLLQKHVDDMLALAKEDSGGFEIPP